MHDNLKGSIVKFNLNLWNAIETNVNEYNDDKCHE